MNYSTNRNAPRGGCCEIAYLAGVMDADGCLTISSKVTSKGKTHLYATLLVEQTKPESVQAFAETFGGKVCFVRKKNPRHKDVYRWQIWKTSQVLDAVERMLPHLRIKSAQAQLILRFCDDFSSKRDKEGRAAEALRRRAIQGMIFKLNRRGRDVG